MTTYIYIRFKELRKPRTLSQGGGRFNGIMKREVLVATPHNCKYGPYSIRGDFLLA